MTFTISIQRHTVKGRLNDSSAAQDFALLLPLSVTLIDYAFTEKICDLPRGLVTRGAPDGFAPRAGDVAYYAPWGNLALFYGDAEYAGGLVALGRIDTGIRHLKTAGPLEAVIELLKT